MSEVTTARVLRAQDGEIAPAIGGVRDRFMVDGAVTEGRFALVQHLQAARAVAHVLERGR